MSSERTAGCVTKDELADYFEGLLPVHRERGMNEHFADCEACTRLAREYRVFSDVWSSWTAPEDAEVSLNAQLAGALERLEQHAETPEIRQRVAEWLRRWAGRAEGAVRVILEAPGLASRLATEGLDALLREGAIWQFVPAQATVQVREPFPSSAVRTRGSEVEEEPPELTPPWVTIAVASGTPQVQVEVSGESGEVSVRLDELPAGQHAPLVLLIPTREGCEPNLRVPETEPGLSCLISRFGYLEPGEYLIALEPVERSDI